MSNQLDALTQSLLERYTKHLDVQQKRELQEAVEKLAAIKRARMFMDMFPDTGVFARSGYVAHMDFIKAGASYRERMFMAGNRVGKTILGAYEITAHATGRYPEWWNGKRFSRGVKVWIGGDTSISVRDIIQAKLLGNPGEYGTGMIPKEDIVKVTTKRNVPDAVETIIVKHIAGGTSVITLKTYEQGRELWQGTEQDIIWCDEEPPMEIYAEALIRTMTTNGIVMCTFTPLRGMSEVIKGYMSAQIRPTDEDVQGNNWKPRKYMIMASWDDAPHLTPEAKEELLATIPPNQRDARSKGVPTIGAGLIYPAGEELYVKDFEIPKHWSKGYAMDVGWNVTGAVFGALDRDTDTLYIYSEYYGQQQEPAVHADAIKRRGGNWMRGVIDPASRGRSQVDGAQLWQIYRQQYGLKLNKADNAVEAGIYEVWARMSSGRLKIFKSCANLDRELKMYHRKEDGKINKSDDHLVDCIRYLCMSGLQLAAPQIIPAREKKDNVINMSAWM